MLHKNLFNKALLIALAFPFLCCMNTEIIDRCDTQGWADQCEVQVGSIKTLKIALSDHLLTDISCCNDEYQISGEIPMKPDTGFKVYHFQLNQAIFSENKREEKEGDIFEQRIEIKRHGTDEDIVKELCRLNNQHTVQIFEMYNGDNRIVGTKSNPMRTTGAGDTTGRNQADMVNSDLAFYRKSTCPACFVEASTIIPTSANSQPFAYIRIARSTGCERADISITPLSRRTFGQIVTHTSPGTQVQIIYTWGPYRSPLFRVSIPADSDPTDIASWTWLSGTSNISTFETSIVESLAGTSTAVTLNLMAKELEQIYPGSYIDISVEVVDNSVLSNVATGRVPFYRNTALIGVFNGQTAGGLYYSNRNCGLLLAANGETASYSVTANAMNFIAVDPGTNSNHRIEFFTDPGSLDQLTLSTPSFTNLVGIGGKSNRLRVLSFSAGGGHELGEFSLRTFPNLQAFSAASAQVSSIDFKQNDNLQDINLSGNDLTDTLDFTVLINLGQVFVDNNTLTSVILGSSKSNLSILDVSFNNLGDAALDSLVTELWDMRANVLATPSIDMRSNSGSLSADSIAKIDGTGAYVGEGLAADYGWTFTY